MADPTKYTPDYSFTDYQANRPSKPLPAPELDIELANIAQSIDSTIVAVKSIRRSDGALKNQIVTTDSLSPTVKAMLGQDGYVDIVGENIAAVIATANSIDHVNTVAAIAPQVAKVSTIDDAVTAVAAIDGEVVDVAVIKADVTAVASVAPSVPVVADIAQDVAAVAAIAVDVSTVAALSGAIPPLATRVLPTGGLPGQIPVKQSAEDGDAAWENPPGGGDMLSTTYDPRGRAADAFDRANHTGAFTPGEGLTPFWASRLGEDLDGEAARLALGAVGGPPISPDDAGKILQVNAEANGADWVRVRDWPELVRGTNKFGEDVSFAYSTAGSIVFITNRIDNGAELSRWYGREAIQISATSASQNAFVQPRQPFMVAPTKKHRFDFFTSSYGPVPHANYMVRVHCYNHWGDYLGKVDINLQAPNTPTTTSYQRAVINEVGGGGSALLAGTEMILPQVGSAGNTEVQGVFMFMMSCIAEDEYAGTMTSTAKASIGTHEAATDGNHLYVLSHGFNQVIKYDLNLKRVASIDVGNYPHDCTILNGALWLANYGAANVQKVDLSTFTLTATYPIPGARAGFGIAHDGETLFVSAGMGAQASRLYRMNPTTGVMTEISSDLATGGSNLPIRIMNGSAWVTRDDTNVVNRVNPLTGALQGSINCSIVGQIYGLGSGDGLVFVNGNRGVAVIDATTNTVIQVHMYRSIWRGESNVEVHGGFAYAVAGNGVMVIDYARNEMREIELSPAEGKWARALPNGSVVIGSYAAAWLHMLAV